MPLSKKTTPTTKTLEKKVQAKPKSSPRDGNQEPKRLPFRRFFKAVRDDVEVIPEALDYYEQAVEDGGKHIRNMRGNLETLMVETPGLAYLYRGIRTDAQQIRRWLEKALEGQKASKYKYFHSDPDSIKLHGKFKTGTEITRYVEADDDIQAMEDIIRAIAEAEHRLDDLMEGFEERRLMLSRVLDIHKEGLKPVWVDPEAGDDNT